MTNVIQLPVHAVQNEIASQVWYLEDINGKILAIGEKPDIDAIAEILNASIKRTDEVPGIYETESTAHIACDGADFLAAIHAVEGLQGTRHQSEYLGWTIGAMGHHFIEAWKGDFYLRCTGALDLIYSIYVLETEGATKPAEDEAAPAPVQEGGS